MFKLLQIMKILPKLDPIVVNFIVKNKEEGFVFKPCVHKESPSRE